MKLTEAVNQSFPSPYFIVKFICGYNSVNLYVFQGDYSYVDDNKSVASSVVSDFKVTQRLIAIERRKDSESKHNLVKEDMTSSFDSVLHTQQASLLAVICSGGKDGVSSKHFILYSNDSSLHAKVCCFQRHSQCLLTLDGRHAKSSLFHFLKM